ncbi:hypothetical protein BaRGS_00035007 [Batillaria attramentaria]|uniref:Uncharacterized protein n=1 Tax=Batillaria attramentaria TaxID=370345 RepID=A0ABD0JH49_9CAEN
MKDVKTIFTVLVFYALAVKPVSEVLNCFWSDTPEPECTEEPGYLYAGLNETTLTIKIPSAREEHEGKYLCQILDSTLRHNLVKAKDKKRRKAATSYWSPSLRRRGGTHKKTSRSNADNAEAIPLNAENTPDSPSSSPHVVDESQLLAKSMVSERNKAAQMNVTDGKSLADTSINALMNTDRYATAGLVTSGGRMSWSRGTVSWDVEFIRRLVYITWGVSVWSKNWLAVGMSRDWHMGQSESAFDCMYNHETSKDVYFVKKNFQTNQFPVIFRDDNIEIEGVIKGYSHTVIEIIIRPVDPDNLAGPIRSSLLQRLPESLTSGGETPITDGDSLAKKRTMDLINAECEVTAGFLIENWTKFNLLKPAVKPEGGVVTLPPCNVAPATREAMVAKKKDGSPVGSWGTLSYTLENCDHLVFIMWCVPANQNMFKNYLAVGVSRKGYLTHGESKEAFDQMYERKRTKKLSCNLKEFQTNAFPVIFRDGNIEIEGTMGYGSRTEIKIIIRPLNRKDLAEPAEAPRLQKD